MAETTMFVFGSHGRIAHLPGGWYSARWDPGGANRCEAGLIVSSGKWTRETTRSSRGRKQGGWRNRDRSLQSLNPNFGRLAAAKRQRDIHRKRLPVLSGNFIELRDFMLGPIHPLDYLGAYIPDYAVGATGTTLYTCAVIVSCQQESPADIRTLHRTGSSRSVPDTRHPTTEAPETVHRTVRLRLYPGEAATGLLRTALAGACRHVGNHLPADQERRYRLWQVYRIGPKPVPTFFTLGLRFTARRHDPDHAWLKAYPYQVVRYSLKYLADAYTRFFADAENEGKPRFKARHRTVPGFTLPEAVRMDGDRLHVPKVGWLRLAGSDPYAGCKPLTVRVRMEGTEQHPKWYAYICYEVPAEQAKQPAADGALGLDRNVGQATDSEGTVYAMPDTDRLDARITRKQRELSRKQSWGPKDRRPNRGRRVNGQLNKLQRKRDDATHQASRKLADTAHTVVVEDPDTKGMTQSAKGTVEAPGQQVKQKSGLNRSILASGWGLLERKLAYKAGDLRKVDPAYTSQTCSRCGHVHRDNRPSQAVFACGACGFRANADHNAALNILARAGLPSRARFGPRDRGFCTARGDPLGSSRTREQGMPTA